MSEDEHQEEMSILVRFILIIGGVLILFNIIDMVIK